MNFQFQPENVKTSSPGVVQVRGFVTTTTSGTIGSSNVFGGGASIAKTGAQTGRYTITLQPPALPPGVTPAIWLANLQFMGGYATIVGPDSAALTTTKGLIAVFRDDDISQAGAKDGTIEIQWVQTNAGNADTEVQDAASFYFCIDIGNPNVN